MFIAGNPVLMLSDETFNRMITVDKVSVFRDSFLLRSNTNMRNIFKQATKESAAGIV